MGNLVHGESGVNCFVGSVKKKHVSSGCIGYCASDLRLRLTLMGEEAESGYEWVARVNYISDACEEKDSIAMPPRLSLA